MSTTKLVCLGDSITWGFPYGPGYSWVETARRVLGVNMINRGINGDTAADLKNRFIEDVLQLEPTHVLVMVGTNDASIGLTLEEYSGYIKEMVSAALAQNIRVIIGLPIPSADRWLEYTLEKYRHWLKSYAKDKKLGIVDFSAAMTQEDLSINPNCYSDEVHPSVAGYQAMTEEFCDFFRRNSSFFAEFKS